jgi:hypothetical protein
MAYCLVPEGKLYEIYPNDSILPIAGQVAYDIIICRRLTESIGNKYLPGFQEP